LIFVLSPGVDPTKQVYTLAETLGKKVGDCSLGQGQAPVATRLINEGLEQGTWVFLANCHLAASWLPQLEKIIEDYCELKSYHPDFRLWLSSSPTPKFPLTVLQRGIKMTTEPPQGLRANMLRLYNLIPEEEFDNEDGNKSKYKKLLFCLSWFHSLLLERRKFKALGWNIPYGFNDADFLICENIIRMYLNEYPDETPWDAMRYLVAQANYGGRITDDWDRRLCNVYMNQFFCEDALNVPNFALCSLQQYYIPDDGDMRSYKEYIATLPLSDHPTCFGQHANADISSMMTNSQVLLDTVLSLQPRVVTSGGESNEDKVLATARDLLTRVPEVFDMFSARETLMSRSDPDPLKSVLLQEMDRYNALLVSIREGLIGLELGVQGIQVITPELEDIFNALLAGKVPEAWGFCYPSLKPLGSWIRDLSMRCEFFAKWLNSGLPKVYWLSGFTYPTGFLTALLQTTARNNGTSIDSLSWEFQVLQEDEAQIRQGPKEGAYISGIYLEGARWDADNGCLVDANPLELISGMPVIHFKPVENKKKTTRGVYLCPLYLYPVRTGTRERPSFMIAVDLKSGSNDGEFWTKRGCALLLATAL
jgi:dynein heavy chain